MDITRIFEQTAFMIGNMAITFGQLAIASACLLGMLLLFLIITTRRASKIRLAEIEASRLRAIEAEARVADILKSQAEMQGRLSTIAEVFGSRQSELNESINTRLESMTTRLGASMSEQQKSTHENLSKLQERLAVIDKAQDNISQLAGNVVELQSILSNKQTRGAFGQSRMETIIADGLPMGAFEFQTTLSNGNRPDCTIKMPNDAPDLVIDAKFPLESWNAIRKAEDSATVDHHARQFRNDMDAHIKAISSKYLITGETQDTAFLFVPSESIFADIHEHHETIVHKAHKARIVIVSPSLLMLSIQVIQALLKDARMREQAHLIQTEVMRLMEDLGRLDDRVHKLQNHFGQANKDIDDILVSTGKLTKRGQRIEGLEFKSTPVEDKSEKKSADSKTGQLRLRVVDGDD
ncbi:DNA recombination protein RmuC [Ahrensia kielensis]|uniref:DNA recombination protein RmuC n=1 Tax=Ahrensia kielensis TaxID=76980 RepID=UPI0003711485|nr:DNA recombination protein RmuC [Ahrensia kielensis]